MKWFRSTNALIGLYLLQWVILLAVPGVRLEYFLVGMTLLFVLLADHPWHFVVLQILFVTISLPITFKAVFFGMLFLVLLKRHISLKLSLLLLAIIFILLARFDDYRIPVVFPGVIAIGAVVYAMSRVRGVRQILENAMPAYVAATILYIFVYLFAQQASQFKPVFAVPLDLIQLATTAVVVTTFRLGDQSGSDGDAA